ncbi:MAG: hypothetical protein ACI83D_000313 [Planctomycetota bacterium]|jgi:hypothetical protein
MDPHTQQTLAEKNFSLLHTLVHRALESDNKDLLHSAQLQAARLLDQFPLYAASHSADIEQLTTLLAEKASDEETLNTTTFNGQIITVGRTISTPRASYTLTAIQKKEEGEYLLLINEKGMQYLVPKTPMEKIENIADLGPYIESHPNTPDKDIAPAHVAPLPQPRFSMDIHKEESTLIPNTPQGDTSQESLTTEMHHVTKAPPQKEDSPDITAETPLAAQEKKTESDHTTTPYTPGTSHLLSTLLADSFTKANDGSYPDWEHLREFNPEEALEFHTDQGPVQLSMNAEYFVYPERFGVTITDTYHAFQERLRSLAESSGTEPDLHESISEYTYRLLK